MQYFVTSVDCGSFHAAAHVLITTQPNVSKVVKSLEEEMGMTLLMRKRSGVFVTPEGERIYQYALNVLKNFKVLSELKEKRDEGKLAVCSVPGNQLATLLAKFYQSRLAKKILIQFWEGSFEDLMVKVHRRNAEIGFLYLPKRNQTVFESQIRAKGLEFCELAKLPLYVFLGKENPLAQKEKITEKDVRELKMVQREEEKDSLYSHLGMIKENVFYQNEHRETLYTNSEYFLLQLLKNTDYCLVGSSFLKEEYEEYGICAIPIRGNENEVSFGYVKRRRDALSDIAQEFLQYLMTQIEWEKKE